MARERSETPRGRPGRAIVLRISTPLSVKSTGELCAALRDKEANPIEALDLSNASVTFPRLKSILKALEHNALLRELDLSGCELRAADIPTVMRSIALDRGVARGLRTLLLEQCGLHDEATHGLAILTQQHSKLRTVSLRLNSLGDRSAEALAAGLERNKTLTSMDLSSNRISAPGAEALLFALAKNTTLTSLALLQNPSVPSAVLRQIAARLARNIGIRRRKQLPGSPRLALDALDAASVLSHSRPPSAAASPRRTPSPARPRTAPPSGMSPRAAAAPADGESLYQASRDAMAPMYQASPRRPSSRSAPPRAVFRPGAAPPPARCGVRLRS
jgi:hypothetical protein